MDRESAIVQCIIDEVITQHRVFIGDLLGATRTFDVTHPRYQAIALIKERTEMSLPKIGKIFGRDHTTIVHALDRHEGLLRTPRYEETFSRVVASLDDLLTIRFVRHRD